MHILYYFCSSGIIFSIHVILLACLLILRVFTKNKKIFKFKKFANLFPGPNSFFYFGNSLSFLLNPTVIPYIINDYAKKYGDRYRLWIGDQLVIVFSNPSDIENIMKNVKFLDKGQRFHKFFGRIFGNGTFSSRYPQWKQNRKVLQFPLKANVLPLFTNEMNEISKILIENLKVPANSGQTFDVLNYISPAIFNIYTRTLLNFKHDLDESAIHTFIEAAGNYLYDSYLYMFAPEMIQKLMEFIRKKQFKDMKKKLEFPYNEVMLRRNFSDPEKFKNDQNHKSFLDYVMNDLPKFIFKEEIITYSVGGTETSSITISFCLLLIAMHPNVQDRLFEEIASVFDDDEREVNNEDLKRMTYLDQVIKETLRLYPLTPVLMRFALEDVEIGDMFIPAETEIFINLYGVQRDPRYFPNPEKFNPDNFSAENLEILPKGCYLPFSYGSRNCIGKAFALHEMKIICCHFLRKYSIKTEMRMEDIKLKLGFVINSVQGFKISINERCKSIEK